MFKNYLKTAWRALKNNKFYSLINISGLSVGLAIGILILLWVQDELSFDNFHKQSLDIYKLENMAGTGSSRQIWTNTASAIGVLGKRELPAIKDEVRLSYNGFFGLYTYGDKVFTELKPYFCDASLFSVFDFPLIKGNPANPFPDNNSIVITESTAKRYFGNENPMGKIITADGKDRLMVSGVIKDVPNNSMFQVEMLFPMGLLQQKLYAGNTDGLNLENDFIQYNYVTFLALKPGANLKTLSTQLRDIHLRVKPDDVDVDYMFLPLNKTHLFKSDGSENGMETVRMFIIIAVLILVIACINYVNLSTARSMLRAKEVSMRKIVGAARSQLFIQFIIETVVLFSIAIIFALGLIYMLVPVFNSISGKELVITMQAAGIWKVIGLAILGTLVLSSIYPALLLSSFSPLKALKGKVSAKVSNVVFRKVLVVTQFGFSMVLITGTLIINNQLKYIRSKNIGYNKEHVLAFRMQNIAKHVDAAKSELQNKPGVNNVTWASSNIVRIGGQTGDNWWDGKETGETLMLHPLSVDKDFIPFFKLDLLAGKNFTGSVSDSAHFILNEAAIAAARIQDPIGKTFKLHQTVGTIIGVVKDFHFTSLKQKIEPAIFYFNREEYGTMYIKTSAKDAPAAIAAAEKEWKKYNAGYPFDYAFLDDTFNSLYKSEERTGNLFNVFAVIAIFISCLGLLGLATYTAQVRTREIGIRKVLGASVIKILSLVAVDFIKLVAIAILLAVPITWFVMNKWLQDFAYKTNIGWTVFLISGGLAIFIAIFTISFRSISAALANPVKSLRTE